MPAYAELIGAFEPGEVLESIVFSRWSLHRNEPNPGIPPELFGVVLTEEQAKPLMQTWSAEGGFGSAKVYPFYAYTNKNVWFIHEYDGSTHLQPIPRDPYNMGENLPDLH
jgi:hypothetical protein